MTTLYEFFRSVTVHTNRSNRFQVVLGMDMDDVTDIRVRDPGNVTVARWILEAVQTTESMQQSVEPTGAPTTITMLDGARTFTSTSRTADVCPRLLLPPNWNIASIAITKQLYGVTCRSLDDAVAIL